MAVEERFPWVAVSAVVALALIAVGAMLPPINDGQRVVNYGGLPSLGLARIKIDSSTELLTEQIVAYDPAPLFIPSPMNSSDTQLPVGIRPGALGPFSDLPAKFTKRDPLEFPSQVKIPSSPVEALRRTELHDSPLAMGRVDAMEANIENYLARVEVLKSGRWEVVSAILLPKDSALVAEDWQPLELMGAVTRAGWCGELIVTASSGAGEIDDHFRSILRKNVMIGGRLPVGFYTFRIGR